MPGGRLAGMGARFGGLVLDSIIVGVPLSIIGFFTGAYHHSNSTCGDVSGSCHGVSFSFNWQLSLISVIVGMGYSALLVGLQGQTIGHRAAGVRVVDLDSGGLLGPGRAPLCAGW